MKAGKELKECPVCREERLMRPEQKYCSPRCRKLAFEERKEKRFQIHRKEDGWWLYVQAPSGKHAMFNLRSVETGGIIEDVLKEVEHHA
jgi:hypothetical protein